MELKLAARMLARRFWLIALPVVISAAAAIASLMGPGSGSAGYSAQIRYSAAQEFNLPQRDGDYQDVWLASELTVNAFTDWVRSSSFRGEIRARLDADLDLVSLGIAADNARSIGVIYLSHADAQSLQTIAEATIAVLSGSNQRYFPQLGGDSAQVTILEAPFVAAMPPPLTDRVGPLLRIAVGLFLGLALALLVEALDQRIHDQDDLRRLGLAVIGSVPRSR